MMQAFISLVAVVALAAMSLRADRRLPTSARLPMQWSVTGSVNWTARRRIALAFTPALGALLLGGTTIATVAATPRPGQEGLAVPVVAAIALGLVAVHALHLRLIRATVTARRG